MLNVVDAHLFPSAVRADVGPSGCARVKHIQRVGFPGFSALPPLLSAQQQGCHCPRVLAGAGGEAELPLASWRRRWRCVVPPGTGLVFQSRQG